MDDVIDGVRLFERVGSLRGDYAASGPQPTYDDPPREADHPALETNPDEALRQRLESNQHRDALYRRPLAISDSLALLSAAWVAVSLFSDASLHPWVLLGIPLTMVIAKLLGLYDRDQNRLHRATLDEIPGLFQLATLVTLIISLAAPRVFGAALPETAILVMWLTLAGLLVVGRVLTRELVNHVAQPERCILVGDSRTIAEVARTVGFLGLPVDIVATVPPEAIPQDLGNGGGVGSHAFVELIGPIADRERAHRVILASRSWPAEDLLPGVVDLMSTGMKVSIVPGTARLTSLSYEIDQLPGMAMLGMKQFGISRSSQLIKRAFDVAVSAGALALLAPLLATIAVATKLDSPGPILYRQRRTGKNSREFEILKFRSMVSNAHEQRDGLSHLNQAQGLFKIERDPRITRVGRILRRYSLDELPQLLNVLQGHMSLVGPRPLLPVEDERVEGDFRRRLDVSPGMTGHWQVLGSWRVPMEDMVVLDYLYTANWSLWTDLKLLARTVPIVAAGRGS